jgi:hypothetical protein
MLDFIEIRSSNKDAPPGLDEIAREGAGACSPWRWRLRSQTTLRAIKSEARMAALWLSETARHAQGR